jgi:hypothetical protein
MRRTLLALSLFLVLATVAGSKEPQRDPRPRLYNEISDDPALDRAARALYADKYQVIDIKSAAFTAARPKGHGRIYQDPRPIRELGTRAKALVVYIVTPEGMVTEPRVLTSTDERLAKYLLELIKIKRFFPARLNGVPVFSLIGEKAELQPSKPEENRLFKDGHGIQGARDR